VKRFRGTIVLSLLCLAIGAVAGITLYSPKAQPLVFAVIPADDPAVTHQYWDPIVVYLSEGLGREIELYIVADYTAEVEALRAGHVDFARVGSSSYVMAWRDGVAIEPIVSAVKDTTGLPGYYGYIVVRADSDIENLEDLQDRSFAYVDPQSSSGHVVPAYALQQAGIEVGRVFMSGSHEASVLAVQNGTVEAGAVAQIRYDAALEENAIAEDELRVIWQSDLIPNVPIVVQESMNAELKARLRELFVNMPTELVEGPSRAGEVGYVEIADADYDIIREIEAYLNQ
jgi:phosphonate transport system substrate-binding protein